MQFSEGHNIKVPNGNSFIVDTTYFYHTSYIMHECTCNLRSLTCFVVSPIRFVMFVYTVQHDLAYIIRIKQNLYISLTEKSADLRPKYNTLIYCEKILAVAKKRNGIDSLNTELTCSWILSMNIFYGNMNQDCHIIHVPYIRT